MLQSFGYRDVAGVSVDGAAKQAFHAGVDLEAAEGSSVLAVADGTVAASTYDMAVSYTHLAAGHHRSAAHGCPLCSE